MANDRRKRLVAASYDRIAEHYLDWSGRDPSPARIGALARLVELLPEPCDVLELGCGAGLPVTKALAERHRVTGVDISAVQIALARQHAPGARFVQGDMATLELQPGSFDAVVSFYAIPHVPRDEHAALLARIARWLRPGGLLFATMGAGDSPDVVEPDWLGAPMFFSHFGAETNRELVRRAGLELLEAEVVPELEDGQTVRFLWLAARRPPDD